MPTAKKDETNIVQLECDGYKDKVCVPVVAMVGGVDLQRYVDLLVPCPAKITLLKGEGPMHLVGSHCVDFSGYSSGQMATDGEDTDGQTEEDEEEKEEVKKNGDAKKKSAEKKRKMVEDDDAVKTN